ncbi:MAG: hypothetical protein COT39_02980 [Parcubacteria group bacterium CG08_land_8_20_14_0_20_48_21]|nr:MAG: hypothetical protein AUK21_00480 [Parcubacteria group bacterium CG2_30_48_51]PIS32738.1 MAG: hypothetical protein COT39_02980 [Parcubacteria group bacterium CG08_land_8_20_14_0_20_48_21]PIW78812.1 MAG: hypothetical protein COZ99_04440 [Parcubacteria group bacterium CG_4_8_14_3_um_filter_48_16]PIY78343.1 MAG: hypothetical protein COY83_00335 [Parcubacteria group bacterium CG_4_10_14_0_8_um_filter_48_154]PIZ77505.1 MAG: hypothetical protein COY03_02605 [bacterium CG_4_10_14_0_2_um_filter_
MEKKSTKKKLCLAVTLGEQGGAQRYVYDLATHVPKEAYEITVAVGRNGTWLQQACAAQGIRTHILRHTTRAIMNPLRDIVSVWELYAFLRREKFDLVHANSSKIGFTASLGARLAGVPRVIYTAHGFVFAEPLSWWRKVLYWLIEWASAPLKDVLITVSRADERLAKKYHIKPKTLLTIHNGIVPPDFFSRKESQYILARRSSMLDFASPTIGVIANLYPAKGLRYIVEAAELLKKQGVAHQMIIIGEGPERPFLEELITRYRLNDTFRLLGEVPNAARYLRAFEVFVLPSVKEGFPYTLLEAVAAAVPTVATRVGGIPEIAAQYDALTLVPPHDAQALAYAVQKILTTPLPEKKERAFPFPLDKMLTETLRAYKN